MAEESYYELLQVTPTADLKIITTAYRALIRRHHPDRNPSPSADATTKLLDEAWEILSDPARRAEYDRTFAADSPSRPAPPPRPPNRPTQETPPPRPKPSPPPRASQPEPNGDDSGEFGAGFWVFFGLTLIAIFIVVVVAVALRFE